MLNNDELKSHIKKIAFIISILAIAYFPVWSFIFSLKNDFYTQYFLQRFFIGESISSHVFPLWNPYFNYGLPVFNDMNGGFWYPLTWINGIITGYNAYSFALEEVLHFPIAALGMYALGRHFQWSANAKIIAAISYACCGYFVAHTQHYNWITGAAWLPWCLLAVYRCIDSLSLKNLCLGALTLSFFISGSHPGLIIGGIYFFLLMSLVRINENRNYLRSARNLLALLLLVAFCMAGLIYSYAEIIPLFTRSGKIPARVIMNFSTPPRSFFSFFLPLPYTQTTGEEITMNNLYAGLLIIISVMAGIAKNRKKTDLYLLAVAGFFFLISTNLTVSVFLISKLPLLQYVRLNGELRIFGMMTLMIYGTIQFDHLLRNHKIHLRNISLFVSACLLVACIYTLIAHPETARRIVSLTTQLWHSGNREMLKNSIHAIGFHETVVIQSLLQCIMLLALAFTLVKKNQWLLYVVSADLVMATLLNMPFTGVSMRPTADIQAILQSSPSGFPMPYTDPEKDIYRAYPDTDTLTGNWSFYGKQIAIDEWAHYPMLLQTTKKYFDEAHQQLKNQDRAFLFTRENAPVILKKFSPNEFVIHVETRNNDQLIIKQNMYPGWVTSVNKVPVIPDTAYFTFPAIPIKKGHNEISHVFRKPLVTFLFIFYWAGLISLTIALILSVTVFRYRN